MPFGTGQKAFCFSSKVERRLIFPIYGSYWEHRKRNLLCGKFDNCGRLLIQGGTNRHRGNMVVCIKFIKCFIIKICICIIIVYCPYLSFFPAGAIFVMQYNSSKSKVDSHRGVVGWVAFRKNTMFKELLKVSFHSTNITMR